MFLALREMRRAKVRFGLLAAAIGLLLFLILTQQAIQNGLITAFVGAIERQSAPVLVYSTDGQRTLQGASSRRRWSAASVPYRASRPPGGSARAHSPSASAAAATPTRRSSATTAPTSAPPTS